MLEDGGATVFLTPATPFYTRKKNSNIHEAQMRKNVLDYQTEVVSVHDSVFGEYIHTFTGIVITTLKKIPNLGDKLVSYTSEAGIRYENAPIEGINLAGYDLKLFLSMREKCIAASKKFGSVGSLVRPTKNNAEVGCYVQAIRGATYRNDMFTIVSNNPDYYKEATDNGLKIILPRDEWNNFYTYAKTFVARFCVSIMKIDQHLDSGQFSFLPLVDFSKKWTDAELAELIGFTEEEMNEIYKVLPDYHNLLGTNLEEFTE